MRHARTARIGPGRSVIDTAHPAGPPDVAGMPRRTRSTELVAVIAIVIGITLPATPSRASAQRVGHAATVDTALLELRIGATIAGLVPAYRLGDIAVVALDDVLSLAGFDAQQSGRTLVSPRELAGHLHADVTLDWSALVLLVADSGTLPVSRRAARSRAREALRARSAPPITAPLARSARIPTALALDYAASRDGGVTLDVGTRAVGGAIDVGIGGLGARMPNTMRVSWESIGSDDTPAPRWRVGTLEELQGRAGVRLTNAALALADSIGVVSLQSTGTPGSEVDVYLDGALVATDTVRADGTVHLRTLERPGAHDVRVVGYAADGSELVLARRRIVTPDALLPAHAVRYTVAIAPCSGASCAALAGNLAFAPLDGLTIRAGVQPRSRRGSEGTVSLDMRLADAIVLAARADPATGMHIELYRDRADGTGIALRSTAASTGVRATSLSGTWRVTPDVFTRAEVERVGCAWRSTAGVTLSTRVGTFSPSVALVVTSVFPRRARWGIDALLVGGWLPDLTGPLRRALVRVHAGITSAGAMERMVTLVFPASPRLSIEASAVWRGDASPHRPVVSLGLRRRLRAATVRMTAERGGIVPMEHEEVSGSVVVDAARRRMTTGADPLAGRAGVHGRVFVDRDGDGRYGPGDEPVVGVALRIGGTAALTDADGGFEAWDLAPYRRVLVEVDSLSIDAERLEPPTAVSVQPTPHALVWIDVPIRARKGGGA